MAYICKVIPAPAGTSSTNVVYIPALAGTVVDLNSTQTLTNKTFTAPTFTNAVVTGGTFTNATLTTPTVTGGTATNTTLVTPTVTTPAISGGTANGQTITNATVTTPTMTIRTATFAAAGSAIGNATAVTTVYPAFVLITAADGTKGVQLPVAVAGAKYIIKNSESANAVLKVYPQVNSQINEATANTALSMAANTCAEFIAYNTTAWYALSRTPA